MGRAIRMNSSLNNKITMDTPYDIEHFEFPVEKTSPEEKIKLLLRQVRRHEVAGDRLWQCSKKWVADIEKISKTMYEPTLVKKQQLETSCKQLKDQNLSHQLEIKKIRQALECGSAINRKNLDELETIKKSSIIKDKEIASLKDHIRAIGRESEMLSAAKIEIENLALSNNRYADALRSLSVDNSMTKQLKTKHDNLKLELEKMECEILKRAAEKRNLTKVLNETSDASNQVAAINKLQSETLVEKEPEIDFLIRNLDESDQEMQKQQAEQNEKIVSIENERNILSVLYSNLKSKYAECVQSNANQQEEYVQTFQSLENKLKLLTETTQANNAEQNKLSEAPVGSPKE